MMQGRGGREDKIRGAEREGGREGAEEDVGRERKGSCIEVKRKEERKGSISLSKLDKGTRKLGLESRLLFDASI